MKSAPSRPAGAVEPLVTVVVPAFNAEAWIGATLDSIAAQTWPKLEILIVDDGSTDDTAAIAEAFCAREPRARLIRKANGGVASARNRGIAEAKGEWIAPIDADDLWHPAAVEKRVRTALAAPERPGFVYAWFRTIDGEGRVTASAPQWEERGRALHRLAYFNLVGNGSGLLLDAAAARAAGGYEEGLQAKGAWGCEDWLLQLEIAAVRPIECVPEFLIGYRTRPDAMSGDSERMHRSGQAVMKLFRERQGEIERPAMRRQPARRYFYVAEGRAIRGDWPGMAAMLARALRSDPARTALLLLCRIARMARRVLGPKPRPAERPRFEDCPTIGAIVSDPYAIRSLEALIARLDRRRLRKLARRDEASVRERNAKAREAMRSRTHASAHGPRNG